MADGASFHEDRMMMPKNFLISGTRGPFYGSARGQWRAMRHGIAGIYGSRGNVESVTYRF
jgi:hypothetical protein